MRLRAGSMVFASSEVLGISTSAAAAHPTVSVPPRKSVHAQRRLWRRKFTGTAHDRHQAGCLTRSKVTGGGPVCVRGRI
jgi:hypothetical protein